MTQSARRAAAVLLVVGVFAALTVYAAPAPTSKAEVVKDRASFIPTHKYHPRGGKVVGVLIANVVEKMAHEGRGSRADAMGFSSGGGSYNWVYVPVLDGNAEISNLKIKIGEKGDRQMVYPRLGMAIPSRVKQWGVEGEFALVEMEVNDGQGAPADQAFVGTKMTKLDGTRDYPINIADAVKKAKEQYVAWKAEEKTALDKAMDEARQKALKDKKPTGPREEKDIFYVTWLPETQKLRVHFRTRLTDGEYKFTEGGIERDPPPLPLPPIKGPPPPGVGAPPAALPPPPPREVPRVRYGMSYGIEFGLGLEFNKNGELERKLLLPAEAFQAETKAPQIGPIRRPIDLPPPPRPLPDKN